jgi:hypothetical protein
MIKALLIMWVVVAVVVITAIISYIVKELIWWEPDYMYYTSDPRDEGEFNWKFDKFYEQKPVYDKTDDMIYSLYEDGDK